MWQHDGSILTAKQEERTCSIATQLTEAERNQVYALKLAGFKPSAIALQLGRHQSAIYRELRHNRGLHGYRPRQAQQMRGAYVIGKSWTFVLLNKKGEHCYEYFRSQDFSAIKLPELQGIYRNLLAVKAML